jgi:muconolactone delta-isomerase
MEFLEIEVEVPRGTPASEVEQCTGAEASAAPRLVDEGHLLRLWWWTAVRNDPALVAR